MKKLSEFELDTLARRLLAGEEDFDAVTPNLSTNDILMLGGLLTALQSDIVGPVDITKIAASIECEVMDEIEAKARL